MGKPLTPPLESREGLPRKRPSSPPASPEYLFSVVGTSRCDVRAACSGAIPSTASVARMFVPPATTRAGTAQRPIPTIALNTYEGEGRGEGKGDARCANPVGTSPEVC